VNIAAPWPEHTEAEARVLHVQTKLHAWAASDDATQFGDLYNLVHDRASLVVAWHRVRANRGSRTAGVDGLTRGHIERSGVERFLDQIRTELKARTYRPSPVRRVGIPKAGGKVRRLGIGTLKDRVVQMALKLVLEPVFEWDQYVSSYAYRPGRRAQDAVAEVVHFVNSGYQWVIEGDVESCFDQIQHRTVVEELRRRITDPRVIALCKAFLKAGVLTELGSLERQLTGTPQGGIVSPLFANLALTAFDRVYQRRWADWTRYRRRKRYLRDKGHATYRLVRYSDDFVLLVMGTREQAEALKQEAAEILRELGLTLSRAKTLVTHVDDGLDFLGFHIVRKTRSTGRRPCAYTFPSKEVLMRTKRKVKALTTRSTRHLPLDQVLRAINPVLRGVAYYFRHAAASRAFSHLGYFTWWRIARWLRKKHPRRSWKWLKRRYALFGRTGAIGYFDPGKVRIVRYRFRGAKIATPWNTEHMQDYGYAFRQIADERHELDRVQRSLVG
jgi:RNA-directed DNA polymerase